MEVRPGYKQTEVGVIPEDWDVVEAFELDPFITSGSRGWAKYYSDRGALFMRMTNLSRESIYPDLSEQKFVDLPKTETEGLRTALQDGDILISITADIGIIGYINGSIPKPAYINQHIACLRLPPKNADSLFQSYYLASHEPQKRFAEITDVGAKTGINLTTVGKLKLLHPSLSEQHAIAVALSDVDGLLDGLDRLIAKKRDVKQAAMQQLLTGKTRLPGFEGEWETVRLADVSAFITKGSTPTTYGFGWQLSGVLFLRSECVSSEGLDLAQSMFISAEAHRVLRRSAVQSNDLLITITGNVGRVVRLPRDFGEANINQHIARIRIVDEATHPGWVYHFLSQPGVRQHFEKITTGQAYPQISLAQVRDAVIPRPAIAEQREISAALDDMDGEITVLKARRDKTCDLKQAMMQELLTGKTRLVPAGMAHA